MNDASLDCESLVRQLLNSANSKNIAFGKLQETRPVKSNLEVT